MRIYPTPGLLVRDPIKRDFLPEEGRDVPDGDFYWIRRIGCGDATTEKPVAATAAGVSPPASPAAQSSTTTKPDNTIGTEGSENQ